MEKSRRPADFLTIDPSSTFMTATSSSNFGDDLPENFLDSANSPLGQGNNDGQGSANSPQLASLAPMSMSSADQSTSYQVNQYGSLKDDGMGSGPAGLLSPLHLDRRSSSNNFSQRNSSIYIKEEVDALDASPPQHLLMSSLHSQQDLDRNDATPPAVSNVELASTMITTILGDQASPVPSSSSVPTPTALGGQLASAAAAAAANALSQVVRRPSIAGSLNGLQQDLKVDQEELAMINGGGRMNGDDLEAYRYQAATSSRSSIPQPVKRIYSTNDVNDPLNAEIDDDIYIDTKDLCKRIAYELKQHSIPQAIFAERILCRSQGTLSDLLRNPKPWNKLKSGRETFRRMFNWVQQPLAMRLGILDMYNKEVNPVEKAAALPMAMPVTPTVNGSSGGGGGHSAAAALGGGGGGGPLASSGGVGGAIGGGGGASGAGAGLSPPTPAQNVRHHRRSSMGEDGQPMSKRPRLVFTDIQKRTLQAIFKETQRPSREMQQTIAEHLRLDLSTVANFFMNARRRSRLTNDDEPAPYQQVPTPSPSPSPPPTSTSSTLPPLPPHPLSSLDRLAAAVRATPSPSSLRLNSVFVPSSSSNPAALVRAPIALLSPPSSQEGQQQPSRSSPLLTPSTPSSISLGALLAPLTYPQHLQQQQTKAATLRAVHHALHPPAPPRKVFVARANGLQQAKKRCMQFAPASLVLQRQKTAAAPAAPAAAAPVQPSQPSSSADPSPVSPSLLALTPQDLISQHPQFAGIPPHTLAEVMQELQQQQTTKTGVSGGRAAAGADFPPTPSASSSDVGSNN
ncbi:hypothetical protein PFISCL1PPCAC_6914 [Pristionchus fissidentatus]|uniref:One cut domain family member n=1 Tax=Pristionchus fissidentatus TaxID=1538716 RepID=A0AAV5V9Y7_9BILA|nr:hypothetical protein PFISCL1PPCAC_6914 [Pristionchus fissidentatus]